MSRINSSNKRPISGFRSRDKLPEIGLSAANRLNNYKEKVQNSVHKNVSQIDMATLTNITKPGTMKEP